MTYMIDDPGPPSDGGRWPAFEQLVAEFLSDLMIQQARDSVRAARLADDDPAPAQDD